MLRAIAADAEVGGVEWIEALLPYFLAASFPALRNGVADEENIDVALLGPVQKPLMPLVPAFVGS